MSLSFAWGYVRTQVGTTVHKFWVTRNLVIWVFWDYWQDDWRFGLWFDLLKRAVAHDCSKYRWDEAQAFAQTIDRLRTTTYGSPDYEDLLRQIKPAINRHYARNRHHPEFHQNGFQDMTFADRVEMIADWGAAVRRHDDGDLDRSLQTNGDRFGYDRAAELELREIAKQMSLL